MLLTARCYRVTSGIVMATFALAAPAIAQAQNLSKGYQMLLNRGFQIQAVSVKENGFHLQPGTNNAGGQTGGYLDAGYNTVNWCYSNVNNAPNSNVSALGAAPGIPWARWVDNQADMPPMGAEAPYMSSLVGLSLADEQDLNNQTIRDAAVQWFTNAKANPAFNNTILYTNSWGGQIADAPLIDFVNRAKPDMMSFDTYPFQSTWVSGGTGNAKDYAARPDWANMTSFYSELRRYRDISKGAGIPFSVYTQTFSSVQDYNQTVYHDPSPSEMRLNNFAAVAFGAKQVVGFTYNTGASSLFVNDHHGGGDATPTPLYEEQKLINKRLKNWGNTLVRLRPVDDWSTDGTTTSTLMLRGKHYDAGTKTEVLDPLPINFIGNANNPAAAFSSWQSNRYDTYLRGWTITNIGNKNINPDTGRKMEGDVFLSWFKPLDESFDGPNYTGEVYMILVNGLSDPTGSVADCTQTVRLNFFSTMPGIQMLDPETGSVININVPQDQATGRKLWDVTLGGGDAILFKFNTGAPFIGVPEPASVGMLMLGLVPVVIARPRRSRGH
ncbi:MAG TPA: beta-galactosidase [Tepidisphaeraceae bacterium]|jgi:hypothetical protein